MPLTKISLADLRPAYRAWITAPVQHIQLPSFTVARYLDEDPATADPDDVDAAENAQKACTGSWMLHTENLQSDMARVISELKRDTVPWNLFSFHCGYETKSGHISDWHVPTEELEEIFSDMPFIEWNAAESYHEIQPTAFEKALGIDLEDLTLFDLNILYAIIYDRLALAGALTMKAEDPIIDLTQVIYMRETATVLPKSTTFLPITSADNYPSVTTEDCKIFLTITLKSLMVKGHNPTKLGITEKGWKRVSKSKDKATGETYRTFTHTDGLEAQVFEQSVKLVLTSITGLPTVTAPTAPLLPVLASADFI